MRIEEALDDAGRDDMDRKINRYRCSRCGAVEVLATHGEEPECPRCGNRMTLEP